MQLFFIRREQGRLQEMAPLMQDRPQLDPDHPAYKVLRATLAMLHAVLGDHDAALTEVDHFPSDALADSPSGLMRIYTLCILSETCSLIGDAERGRRFYAHLLPYADRTVVTVGASVCLGSVARFLGLLAALDENWETAASHLAQALEVNAAIGSTLWVAHTQCDLASVLIRRGRDEDRAQARVLLLECAATATERGLTELGEAAHRSLDRL
jgi:hypothetical protein